MGGKKSKTDTRTHPVHGIMACSEKNSDNGKKQPKTNHASCTPHGLLQALIDQPQLSILIQLVEVWSCRSDPTHSTKEHGGDEDKKKRVWDGWVGGGRKDSKHNKDNNGDDVCGGLSGRKDRCKCRYSLVDGSIFCVGG